MPLAMKCQINNGGYLQLRSFTCFAPNDDHLKILLDGGCPKAAILAQLALQRSGLKWAKPAAQLGTTIAAPGHYNFNSGAPPSSKIMMGFKRRKTTTPWWPASNLRNVPTVMKCQINNQKSQSFPDTDLNRIEKTGRYLQLRNFTFLH